MSWVWVLYFFPFFLVFIADILLIRWDIKHGRDVTLSDIVVPSLLALMPIFNWVVAYLALQQLMSKFGEIVVFKAKK